MVQVALTRIFSVMLWNHFAFLVISTALLGFGAAGSFLAVRPRERSEAELRQFLSRNCLWFAVSCVLGIMLVTALLPGSGDFLEGSNAWKLVAVYTMVTVPFFFAGLAICQLLASCSGQVNSVYFADLVGAGAGALFVTLLLGRLGAPATVLVACVLAVFAGFLFESVSRRRMASVGMGTFAILAAVVYLFDPWTIPVAEGKGLHGNEHEVTDTYWSLHGRIDFLKEKSQPPRFGCGVHRVWYDRRIQFRTFYMDGSNPSRLIRDDQDQWFVPKLLSAAPYQLEVPGPKVLIIGSGGGVDTRVALHHGAEKVTAIEINRTTVQLVKNDFSSYIGDLFRRPEVELLAREGRHFLTMGEDLYDVIRLTGVDTRAAASVGANALDHVYLYTTEAVRDLFHRLSSNGVVAISRGTGWQDLRLANIVRQSLEELEIEEPWKHILVVTNDRWSDVLVSRRPLGKRRVKSLRRWAEESKLEVLFDPYHEGREDFGQIIQGSQEEREEFLRSANQNLAPVTDDRPFFFERYTLAEVLQKMVALDMGRVSGSGFSTLLLALGQALVMAMVFILLPLCGRGKRPSPHLRRLVAVVYFSLLGLGFILVELVFIQKYMFLLGGPAYAMSVTLFSILVFSGFGSLASRRWAPSVRSLAWILLCLLVLLAGSFLFVRDGLPGLLGFSLPMRIFLAVLAMAPVSFALGMPFPVGIRLLDAAAPHMIPWAWACNGCFSVIGSVLSVILSMAYGFSFSFFVAIACYLVALGSVPLMTRRAAATPAVRV